jgi:choline kinase
VAKPAAAAKPVVAAKPAFEAKSKKKLTSKKPKLVRDSFTIPEGEYQQIAALKQRALEAGHEIKKSELLRAGLAALSAQTTPQFLEALTRLEKLKTGRPAK